MGLQRLEHDLAIELHQQQYFHYIIVSFVMKAFKYCSLNLQAYSRDC